MPRRGRSSPSPSRASARPMSSVPARQAPPPPAPAPVSHAPAAMAPQQPSLFGQMAATAGGVAIGSAVGHTVGHALTGAFSGGSDSQPQQQQQQQPYAPAGQNEPQGPCAWEIKQFLNCAQGQSDLTLCEGFNEALRQCKASHALI